MAIFTTVALVTGNVLLAGAAAAVGYGAYGAYQTKKAADLGQQAVREQQKAAAAARKAEAARETRARRAGIRASLKRRSEVLAAGALGQGEAVSARGGALAGISSQLGANLGFSSMMSGISSDIFTFSRQAAMLQGQSQYASALGGLGFQLAGTALNYATGTPVSSGGGGSPSDRAGPKGYSRKGN